MQQAKEADGGAGGGNKSGSAGLDGQVSNTSAVCMCCMRYMMHNYATLHMERMLDAVTNCANMISLPTLMHAELAYQ